MTRVTVSKIIGPEKNNSLFHYIQTFFHILRFLHFEKMTTLRTKTTQTMTDCGKYERYVTH